MTKTGWVVLAVTVSAIIAGIALGWAELATLGVVLGAALAIAAAQMLGRSTYRVVINVPTVRVRIGESLAAQVIVQNAGRRLVLPATLRVPVGADTVQFSIPLLRASAEHDELIAVPTTRRGVIELGPATTVRGDVLALTERAVTWTDPIEVFVHPEIVRLTGSGAGLMRDLEGQSLQIIADSDFSFHALREYIPGDDRRHIHWKTSARVGDLMVRQFDDTRRTRTALLLTAHPDEYADAAEFELATSVFASLGVQALNEDRDLVALAGAQKLRIGAPVHFLDGCSRLELAAANLKSFELTPWLAREVPDASVAIFVVGSTRSVSELRAQLALVDKSVMILVLRCERGAAPQVRSIGDAKLVRIGNLSDLPRLIERAVR